MFYSDLLNIVVEIFIKSRTIILSFLIKLTTDESVKNCFSNDATLNQDFHKNGVAFTLSPYRPFSGFCSLN